MVAIIEAVTKAFKMLHLIMMTNPALIIVALIAGLVAAFIYLWNTSEGFRNFWIGLWEGIKSAFEATWKAIVNFFTETIPNAFQGLLDKISEIGNNIKIFFEELWNSIVSFFTETIPQWIQNVIDWFANLPYMIGYHIGEILGSIIKFGIDAYNWVTTELPVIIQGIIDWFAELPGRISTWLSNVVDNIITWGQNVLNTAITWVSNTINSIGNWFAQLPGRISTWLVNTINNIVNWGKDMANKGKQAAQDLFDNIINKIKELPGEMLEIGKNIVQGIIDGIKNMASNAGQAISNFGSGLVDGLKSKLGIHSPSRLFRDEVGKFIPQGIAVGIEADTGKAIKAIDSMNDDIMSKMNRAVAIETGSINATASVKSNNSMLNVIQATFNIDGSVDIDGKKAGRILAPNITKTIKAGGLV